MTRKDLIKARQKWPTLDPKVVGKKLPWGRLALWAYAFGPALMDFAEKKLTEDLKKGS